MAMIMGFYPHKLGHGNPITTVITMVIYPLTTRAAPNYESMVECVAKVWPRPFHCGSIYLGFSTHGVYYSTVVHPYTPQMAILFYMGKIMINNDQTSNLEVFP